MTNSNETPNVDRREAAAVARVEARRLELEQRLAALRGKVRQELGFLPKNGLWLGVGILGLAAGVALAKRLRR